MSTQRPILVVDDDTALRGALVEQLTLGGEFAADEAASLAEAEARLANGTRYDALLLDVGLPDGDGREFCRALRARGLKAPIIMLTASTEETDVVHGLEAGANDYIAKPFRLNELLARLRAQLRSFETSEDAELKIGPYRFRPSLRQLTGADGKRIRLTDKEAAILKYLYRAEGRSVSRQTLLGEVWGYNAGVTTHTLETHVYRLRQKIEPDPAASKILVTDSGGYRLNF